MRAVTRRFRLCLVLGLLCLAFFSAWSAWLFLHRCQRVNEVNFAKIRDSMKLDELNELLGAENRRSTGFGRRGPQGARLPTVFPSSISEDEESWLIPGDINVVGYEDVPGEDTSYEYGRFTKRYIRPTVEDIVGRLTEHARRWLGK